MAARVSGIKGPVAARPCPLGSPGDDSGARGPPELKFEAAHSPLAHAETPQPTGKALSGRRHTRRSDSRLFRRQTPGRAAASADGRSLSPSRGFRLLS